MIRNLLQGKVSIRLLSAGATRNTRVVHSLPWREPPAEGGRRPWNKHFIRNRGMDMRGDRVSVRAGNLTTTGRVVGQVRAVRDPCPLHEACIVHFGRPNAVDNSKRFAGASSVQTTDVDADSVEVERNAERLKLGQAGQSSLHSECWGFRVRGLT